jgi:alkanesulfonate monooxygenase SsuD/methylene tetrahydromethanopterin reductase-like flavin-dependent oxidoreductase (luciferase family)
VHFGLLSLCDWLADPAGAAKPSRAERHRQLVRYAVAAEQRGFESVHLGEHHFSDYILSSPAVVLAAIAERTQRLILSTGVALGANHDPVRLAEDYATVDLLSGGRVELVLGRGNAFVNTFKQFGQDVKVSRERFEESVLLLRQLWSGEEITWRGNFRPPLAAARVEPQPVRAHGPLLWMGSGSSMDSIEFAARNGFALQLPGVFAGAPFFKDMSAAYRERFVPGPQGETARRIGFTAHIHVRPDGAEARAFWEPYHIGYLDWVWGEIGKHTGMKMPLASPATAYGDAVSSPALCGSPHEIAERILRWNETLGGIDRLLLKFDGGGMPEREVMGCLDLFAGTVMPEIARGLNRADAA